jgi:hypothetical protein
MPGTTQTQDFRKMRVDQVGSLAAPQKLRAAFKRFKNAEINREELAPFQDDAIREVIQGQEAIGFPIITDGEFRRSNFQESFGAAVTGFHVAKEDKAMEGVRTRGPGLVRTSCRQGFRVPQGPEDEGGQLFGSSAGVSGPDCRSRRHDGGLSDGGGPARDNRAIEGPSHHRGQAVAKDTGCADPGGGRDLRFSDRRMVWSPGARWHGA